MKETFFYTSVLRDFLWDLQMQYCVTIRKVRLRYGNDIFVKELIRAVAWADLHQQLA